MRHKFMALSSRLWSALGVKLKNQVPSNSFGQTEIGCGRIAGATSKIKRVVHLPKIQTKEGVEHAFNSRGVGPGRSWCSSLARQRLYPNGGIHQIDLECCRNHCRGLVALDRFWAYE
jgi:hypothetical protein